VASDTESPILETAGEWWVVHAKTKHEQDIARRVSRLGLEIFLPLHWHRSRWRTIVSRPLFPGYLFAAGSWPDAWQVREITRVLNVIRVSDQQTLIAQLVDIHRVTTSGRPVELYAGLVEGVRCRVTDGPFEGLEGTVLRRGASCRIYIAVNVLGQSAEMEIDADLLEAI